MSKSLKQKSIVVFFDHFDEVQFNSHTDSGLERMIQQLVWLLPNVLFVFSGRDRLSWAQEESCNANLWKNGSNDWPNLVEGVSEDPRQHLVESLSSKDVIEFLDKTLVSHEFNATELTEIADTSNGYPYHLDLIVRGMQQFARPVNQTSRI